MTFDTLIGILMSALLPKIFENAANKNGTKILIHVRLIMVSLIFGICVNIDGIIKPMLNEKFLGYYNAWTASAIFRTVIIIGLIVAIIFAYGNNTKGKCSFEKLSKIIVKFTEQVSDNDILYIFCGDMDVWGGSDNDSNDVEGVRENEYSEEFKQLLRLQEENRNLDIRILCKHCMEDTLIDGISADNYDVTEILTETRLNPAQVKRIAYFKENLKKCSFRFYKDPKEDYSNLRARVIINHDTKKVLVYHKMVTNNSRFMKYIYKLLKKNQTYVYEYKELETSDNYQLLHYVELCNLKWKKCDPNMASKIEEYCIRYSQLSRGEKTVLKKIAFVYAKTYEVAHFGKSRKEFPPFGVMYLAAMVKTYCPEWLAEIIAIEEDDIDINVALYDVIAFSVISAYTVPVFEKCMTEVKNKIKESPNLVCIAGGYQAELEAEKWLKSGKVRLILRGEGENAIVKLLNEGYRSIKTYSTIPGAMFLGQKSGKKVLKDIPLVGGCVDLNQIPFPARELLPEDDYIMNDRLADTNYKMVHVLFSRGCAYNCVYCGVPREGNRCVRYRSPQNIVDELESLKNMGIEGFSIIDDCFLTKQNEALEIIKAISKVGLKWSLAARVDQINEEILAALEESGCLEIKFGIETGSNEILAKMKKGFTVEEAKNAINLVRSHNIGVKAFIITGLPGEDETTNEETKNFLREMGKEKINRVSLLRFVPLPGSHIYNNPKDYGIKKDIKTIDYRCYKLYNGETDWWEDKNDFEIRNKIYEDISAFMKSIWKTI